MLVQYEVPVILLLLKIKFIYRRNRNPTDNAVMIRQ